jgi:hypothetical protein
MNDSKALRVVEVLHVLAVITCIGIVAGVLIHLVGELVIVTYLMPGSAK